MLLFFTRSQVSPAEKNTSETLCSLKFAERVRSVELGPGSRRAELGSWSSQEHLEVTDHSFSCPWLLCCFAIGIPHADFLVASHSSA